MRFRSLISGKIQHGVQSNLGGKKARARYSNHRNPNKLWKLRQNQDAIFNVLERGHVYSLQILDVKKKKMPENIIQTSV